MWDWIGKLIGSSSEVVNKLVQDRDLAAKITSELNIAILGVEADMVKSQGDTNTAEAASPHLFVAGWRPFIGWTCGVGLVYQFLLLPLLTWVGDILLALKHLPIPHPPALDGNTLMALVTGMLGLGGYRTFEKLKGVETLKVDGK